MSDKILTILTTTYNRADMLVNLYDSLLNQTCHKFIWLIVDDGSKDDTQKKVESFISEKRIEIIYHYQQNSGKYIAHNTGVKLCDTELLVCVDSDDELYPNAVKRTLNIWNEYCYDKRIAGIVSPKDMGETSYFINPPAKSSLMDLYNNKQLVGETMLVFKNSVLKDYLFPEIEGENFMSENVIYYRIDKNFLFAVQNEYLYKADYHVDGITWNIERIHWNNPRSTMLMYKNIAAYQSDIIKAAKAYGCYLAWKRIRRLQNCNVNCEIKKSVKLLGGILYWHYYRLFKKMQSVYEVKK